MGRAGLAAAAIVAATMGWAGAASAAPGLANQVYSPYVKNGVTEVEVRGGRLTGGDENGDSAAVVELEHGFSDRLSLAVLGEFEDEPGDGRKLDSIAVEGVAYLGQLPGTGVDVGAYLEYEQRIHNESGKLEGKILLARQFGPVHGLLNLIAEQALTDRPGEGATEFGYAAQGTLDAGRHVQVGLQAFGDLGTNRAFGGRQAHFLGPMARWEGRPAWAKGELEFEAAYLLPVGEARHATDGQVRFALEWEKRF
ncbi:hypothetical protein [Phenylobacterium soli]|uniref:Uncharacterized protein n=1 Tax=Phenylobacterium soli TaxID=2170551 RepID=A0A328ALI6_9CAUL|nr:hypothetical protein [Phenylobacterium soli]RAK55710.1 hypothetical protein DJ017_14930 [Phenylobacterium soli]